MLIPRRVIPAIAVATDSDSTRFALGGVLLNRDPETGDPVAVATDGKRLLAATWAEPEIDKEEYPAYPGIDPSPKKNFSFLFPADRDTLKRLRSLPAPAKGAGCDHVNYLQLTEESAAPSQTTIAASATKSPATNPEKFGTFSTRAVEGRFPRWRDVFPQYRADESTTIFLDARFLSEVAEAVLNIVGGGETREIALTVPHDVDKPVLISAEYEGAAAVGVIMPLASERQSGEAKSAGYWLAKTRPAPTAEVAAEIAAAEKSLAEPAAAPAVPESSPATKPPRSRKPKASPVSPAESVAPPAAPEVAEPVVPAALPPGQCYIGHPLNPVAAANEARARDAARMEAAAVDSEPADISAAWGAEPVDMPAAEVARVAAHAAPPVSGPPIVAEMPGDDDKIRCFIAGRNDVAKRLWACEESQGTGHNLRRMIRLREDIAKYDRLIAERRAELAAAMVDDSAPIVAELAEPLASPAARPRTTRRKAAATTAPAAAPTPAPHAFNAARSRPLDSESTPAACRSPLPVDDSAAWGVVPADITSARPAEDITPAIHKPTNSLEALTCFGAVAGY